MFPVYHNDFTKTIVCGNATASCWFGDCEKRLKCLSKVILFKSNGPLNVNAALPFPQRFDFNQQ